MTSSPIFVLDPDSCLDRERWGREWRAIGTPAEASAGAGGLLLAVHAAPLLRGLGAGGARGRPQGASSRLLLLEPPQPAERELLHALYQVAIMPGGALITLPPEETVEVLASDERKDRFIAGAVSEPAGLLLLYRGDLSLLRVPLSSFGPAPTGTKPDFSDFALVDHGYAVRFGSYEATADAILYENAPDFRRRLAARRREEERTLGASIRRLRIQRGLRRSDFEPDVCAKEIARIERSEVRPRPATLKTIARRLRVGVSTLGEF